MPNIFVNFKIDSTQKISTFLSQKLGLPNSHIQRLFDANKIRIERKVVKDKKMFYKGSIEVLLFVPHSKGCKPIFVTKDFTVFDKPPQLHTHPKRLYNDYTLLDEIRFYGGVLANPAHRLDRETFGLLLCGKNLATTKELKDLFLHQRVKKTYHAVVHGKIDKAFTIDAPIARVQEYTQTKHKVRVALDGKRAITDVFPIFYSKKNDTTIVALTPRTGRTHQLRVHMFHVEHPIVGDPLYGTSYNFADRYLDGKVTQDERVKTLGSANLQLCAKTLEFTLQNRYKIFSMLHVEHRYWS